MNSYRLLTPGGAHSNFFIIPSYFLFQIMTKRTVFSTLDIYRLMYFYLIVMQIIEKRGTNGTTVQDCTTHLSYLKICFNDSVVRRIKT